jgi:hypothetical protein
MMLSVVSKEGDLPWLFNFKIRIIQFVEPMEEGEKEVTRVTLVMHAQ